MDLYDKGPSIYDVHAEREEQVYSDGGMRTKGGVSRTLEPIEPIVVFSCGEVGFY